MSQITRRKLLKRSAATGAAVLMLSSTQAKRVFGANEELKVAVVGFGGRGKEHIAAFSSLSGCSVTALCDADQNTLGKQAESMDKKTGGKIETYLDVRKLLESKNVDAIATATPNHWHSLITIWSCQAGKDVYVEKPISHNVYEGRKCVEAAAKYKRVVQHGTQRRSDKGWYEAFDWVRKGNLGAVQWVKGFCYKPRPSIGKTEGPQPLPAGVNYDLWCGPAPMDPLRRKRLHYDWHWVWPTGNGDIGNQGVHEMDLCRWFVGNKELPERVMSFGGRFLVDDDATTPNTLVTYYDYKPVPFIFEVRGLPSKAPTNFADGKVWPPMDAFGKIVRVGMWIQCENGYFAAGEGGGWAYDKAGQKVKQFKQQLGKFGHQENFVKACKTRKPEDNVADAEVAHLSSACCHLGNISYQVGKEVPAADAQAAVKGNAQMAEAYERFSDHLAKNTFDPKTGKVVLGPTLTLDPKTERFTGDFADEANKHVSRDYRKPYVVPENV
ncbi:MAG TPA: Gfo/Idh/MocA family oxidoreductase [Tepidisphaeraceae bacterium]|nr:Gfo/Idh/MocA family oxidoreductase [Tepidisphaeraceae bacterium]